MKNPLEPKHLRSQKNAIPHVTTEAALRLVDEALALKGTAVIDFDIRLLRVTRSFASMDAESRTSLLLQLIRKESGVEADLEGAMGTRDEYIFPERTNVTSSLLEVLPAADAQKAFWGVLTALGSGAGDTGRELRGAGPATMVRDFISRVQEAFSAHDWRDIGARIMNVYAHDTRIPEDVRRSAIISYVRESFSNVHTVLLRAENNIEEHTRSSSTFVDGQVKDLLELHPAIAGVVLDQHLGGAFRDEMLSYTSFMLCPDDTRKKIAGLAYMRHVDEKLSEGILDWLKFPRPRDEPGAVDSYNVLKKVVQERTDAPSVQFSAMLISLDQDGGLAPRSITHSNIKEFTIALDKIWEIAPHQAQPESRVYGMLARTGEGKKYIQGMIGGDNALRRITGVYAAVTGDPSLVSDKAVIRRCVNDVVAELRNAANRPFCYMVVHRLCSQGTFSAGDTLMLRGLEKALKKLPDEEAANAAVAVEQVLRSLPKIIHIRPEE